MSDPDLNELAEELAEFDVPEKKGGRSPREERVIAAFEDIQSEIDKADLGLNPLGLTRNSIPFDIAPAEIDKGLTHVEQERTSAPDTGLTSLPHHH